MEDTAKNVIEVLRYLLPGFLMAWVYYGLTPHSRPSQFERIVQALIFAVIVEFFVLLERSLLIKFGSLLPLWTWTSDSVLVWSTIDAIAVGVLLSWLVNNDYFHKSARWLGITQETSYPSQWFATFSEWPRYIVLQFHDGRRLFGWPAEWPTDRDRGHFAMKSGSWLVGSTETIITGVELVLIPCEEVRWIEFLEDKPRAANP
jgi:Family of unknown function (DUF6338)